MKETHIAFFVMNGITVTSCLVFALKVWSQPSPIWARSSPDSMNIGHMKVYDTILLVRTLRSSAL